MKYLLLLLPLLLSAAILKVGDDFQLREFKDQKEKSHKLKKNQTIVMTWDKESTQIANSFFDENRELLKDDKIVMIVDVSTTPYGIMQLFVLPKLEGYKHPILLSYDEAYNLNLPYKDGFLTLLKITNSKVKNIEFVETKENLKENLAKITP
ncbi:MAG: hypothetical protein GQ570_09285 [Helicobacteraceae bacterium]|nr:hypothetical protein [Helicobacteraceae bacterium]